MKISRRRSCHDKCIPAVCVLVKAMFRAQNALSKQTSINVIYAIKVIKIKFSRKKEFMDITLKCL